MNEAVIRPLAVRTVTGRVVAGVGNYGMKRRRPGFAGIFGSEWFGYVAVPADSPDLQDEPVTLLGDGGAVLGRGVVTGRRCYGQSWAALRLMGTSEIDDGRSLAELLGVG